MQTGPPLACFADGGPRSGQLCTTGGELGACYLLRKCSSGDWFSVLGGTL